MNSAWNLKQVRSGGNRCIDLAEFRQNQRHEIAVGTLIFGCQGGDHFFELRIAAQRVPEGEQL